jgi:hypothetical protein
MRDADLQKKADATAKFFADAYGNGAELQASLCAYQAIVQNDVEKCRFWRDVLDRLAAETCPR